MHRLVFCALDPLERPLNFGAGRTISFKAEGVQADRPRDLVVALSITCLGGRPGTAAMDERPAMTHSREARPPGAGDMRNQHHSEPWRRRFVPARLRRERLAGQVVRFGIVGVLNTVVDFGLLNVLYHVVGLPLLVANTISVSAGIVNSFLWNKHWTFSSGGWTQWRREAVVFVGVSFVGLLINDVGIYVLHSLWGDTSVLAVNAQKLGASVFSMGWNFVGYRLIAFKSSASSPSEGSP